MTVSIEIPASGSLFEGHFPGRPILPGVAELDLIARACIPDGAAITAIPFVRFRGLVLPGQTLRVESAGRGPDTIRFEAHSARALTANGALVYGAPGGFPEKDDPPPPLAAPTDHGSLEKLIPHRPPMLFVEEVLAESEEGAICRGRIPSACGLVVAGRAPALAALEIAAQTAAVWEALRRSRGSGPSEPKVGYLVSVRDVVLQRAVVEAGEALTAAVRLMATAPPLAHYDVAVDAAGGGVLRGAIGTYLSS